MQENKRAAFLDALIDELNLKNDAALSRALEVSPPVISKIRHNNLPVGASFQIKVLEITGWTLGEMRKKCGDPEKAA